MAFCIFLELQQLFPLISLVKYPEEFYSILSNAMKDPIEKHREDIDEGNPRDFIDGFLVEMSSRGKISMQKTRMKSLGQ